MRRAKNRNYRREFRRGFPPHKKKMLREELLDRNRRRRSPSDIQTTSNAVRGGVHSFPFFFSFSSWLRNLCSFHFFFLSLFFPFFHFFVMIWKFWESDKQIGTINPTTENFGHTHNFYKRCPGGPEVVLCVCNAKGVDININIKKKEKRGKHTPRHQQQKETKNPMTPPPKWCDPPFGSLCVHLKGVDNDIKN